MTPTTINVTFRKQVSDGNYGNEAFEVGLSLELDEAGKTFQGTYAREDLQDLMASLLNDARAAVHGQIAESPSLAVRRSLQRQEPPVPRVSPAPPIENADDEPM